MENKSNKVYLYSTLLLMLIIPIVSLVINILILDNNYNIFFLIGKWFIFWSIGIRLFTAGVKQVIKLEFTAKSIFHFKTTESYLIIRELGFANICMGLIGIISLFLEQWRIVIAISGGLFFGFAGIHHMIVKPISSNEKIAMISNIFIFILMIVYLISLL